MSLRTVLRLWAKVIRPAIVAVLFALLFTTFHVSAAPPDPVLLAAGDIASCASAGDTATAALLGGLTGTVITLGDNVYESGTAAEFAACYDPTWGVQLARTRPAPGNHDYVTPGAAGYYAYFGAAAGDPARGYYSYDVGAWHLVALNSNCSAIGGCGAGSPQETWLRADLAAHPATCTLAYWHHPLFSSGLHGNQSYTQALFQALWEFGADIVLGGHDHDYERFAPQTPGGVANSAYGIREFIVGTGGRSLYPFGAPIANSEVRNSDAYGVLSLTLHPSGYDWQFVPEAGKTFTDSGNGSCHAAPPSSVGVIAEQPDVAALPRATSAATNGHRVAYALCGGALAAVAAVGAGGWYVRRKRRTT